jgi:hypothetical protein
MEFEECFGSTEKCSEDILEKLAKVTNEGLRSKLNGEKIKVVAHRYLKPKNMHSLKTSSVNNEIWRHLDRNVKNQDLKLSSKTQILICKAITSQLQFIDLLLKKTKQERTTLPEGTHKTGHGLFTSPSSFLFSDSDESMISSKSSLSLSLSSLSFLVFVLDVELKELSEVEVLFLFLSEIISVGIYRVQLFL